MDRDRNIIANFERIPAPAPTLTSLSTTNGFGFEWEGKVGREYTILGSTNLSTWINLTNILGLGELISYTDIRDLPRAYYKLSVY